VALRLLWVEGMNLENELSRICRGAPARTDSNVGDDELEWTPVPFGRRVVPLRPAEDPLENVLVGAEEDEPLSWAA
jgi:hypothetical protein